MTNLLAGVDKLVADIAGPLLFIDAVLSTQGEAVIDADGQASTARTDQDVKALKTEYSSFHRGQTGIPAHHRNIGILGHGLTAIPKAGDHVTYEGYRWEIVNVVRDPAKALYECECKPGRA